MNEIDVTYSVMVDAGEEKYNQVTDQLMKSGYTFDMIDTIMERLLLNQKELRNKLYSSAMLKLQSQLDAEKSSGK